MFTGFLAGTFFRKIPLNVLGAKNFHAKEREYIEVNYTIAYQACHYFLGLHDGQEAPNIEGLIRQNILPVRPNRNYARQHRYRVPVSFTS